MVFCGVFGGIINTFWEERCGPASQEKLVLCKNKKRKLGLHFKRVKW